MTNTPKTFNEVVERNCCRYIEGDPKDGTKKFCDKPRFGDSSYCEEHHKLCHREKSASQLK